MAITNQHLDEIKGKNCGHCFWMKVLLFEEGVRKRRYADCRHKMKYIELGYRGWKMEAKKGNPIPLTWNKAETCPGFKDMRDETETE